MRLRLNFWMFILALLVSAASPAPVFRSRAPRAMVPSRASIVRVTTGRRTMVGEMPTVVRQAHPISSDKEAAREVAATANLAPSGDIGTGMITDKGAPVPLSKPVPFWWLAVWPSLVLVPFIAAGYWAKKWLDKNIPAPREHSVPRW